MAVGQNQWYHFGIGAPPILVHFSGWIRMSAGGTIGVLIRSRASCSLLFSRQLRIRPGKCIDGSIVSRNRVLVGPLSLPAHEGSSDSKVPGMSSTAFVGRCCSSVGASYTT